MRAPVIKLRKLLYIQTRLSCTIDAGKIVLKDIQISITEATLDEITCTLGFKKIHTAVLAITLCSSQPSFVRLSALNSLKFPVMNNVFPLT